ncbi:lipid-A-disaccharide synthase [Candidatus Latescibacterota bacterium]
MKRILIIAGETSGDLHGSALMKSILESNPDTSFRGIGGSLMIEAGLDAIRHVRDMNFMGIVEVIRHLPFIHRTLKDVRNLISSWQPDLAILIDYPGFNLKLAPFFKSNNIPLMYYISPQLWAWHKSRVKKIRNYVDRMVVLFDFEQDFYRTYGVDVDFVGHPLLDVVSPSENRDSFRASLGASEIPLIGLLPGSRPQEIDRILPDMIESVDLLKSSLGDFKAVIGCAPELDRRVLERYIGNKDIDIIHGKTYDIMAHADALAVTSGTATLETGILGTPMVVLYKTSPLTYYIGKALVQVDHIGLINIVADSRVVPELIQHKVTPKAVAAYLTAFCIDNELNAGVRRSLSQTRERLGEPGASHRAADVALDMLCI